MSTEHFVTYDDERIPYSIVRSDRRTLAITVARDGTVRVRAPRRTPYAEIVRLVPAKSAWIARKRRDLVSRAAEVPVEPLAPERIAEARRLFGERLEACWATFARPGEVMPELRVRTMRSRWGSLAASGRISLNAHLVRAPAGCLDYVIFHELCHLRVREHGPAFYAELARHVPEWKLRKRELRGVCI